MNYSGKRRKILLLFASLAAALALWLLFKKDEPRYQGKIAREWFYSTLCGEADGDFFKEVIAQTPHTAIPVLLEALEKADSPAYRLYSEVFLSAPEIVQRVLPTPLSSRDIRSFASLSIQEVLLKHPNLRSELEKQVPRLKRLIRSRHKDTSDNAGYLIWTILTEDTVDAARATNYLNHSELLVRLRASVITFQSFERFSSNAIIPVFVEVITNKPAMDELFGRRATEARQTIWDNLRRISPEAAANYSQYLE